ncbi:MAG: SIS domain-containing protein [Thiotrichales bacterium]
MTQPDSETIRQLAVEVLDIEAEAVRALRTRIGAEFVRACELMLACTGRIVVTGMGKSGHVGGKIAATLASTGSPAFFVHPGEASHGDLGMITMQDVVLSISNSGETDEILTILPLIKRLGVPMVAMTGNPHSRLATQADVNLDVSVAKEACPLNLAPTSSTTATLALGDALAVSLLKIRGFTAEDFARSHPGGKLGRRLLLNVGDVMHPLARTPMVGAETPLRQALDVMSRMGLGFTAVVDSEQRLLGVFTDGDLRRSLDHSVDIHRAPIGQHMTAPCRATLATTLAVEALNLMEAKLINALPVIDADGRIIGAINMHDLLRAGVV